MTDFVTEKQFLRARKIIRKLLYQNTMEDYSEDLGYLNYDYDGSGNYTMGVEGHKMLKIRIEKFSLDSEDLANLEDLEEIKERDKVRLDDDGLIIVLNQEGDDE